MRPKRELWNGCNFFAEMLYQVVPFMNLTGAQLAWLSNFLNRQNVKPRKTAQNRSLYLPKF
jgi:hypothetical protein